MTRSRGALPTAGQRAFRPRIRPVGPRIARYRCGHEKQKRLQAPFSKIICSLGVYLAVRYGTSADIRGRGEQWTMPCIPMTSI